VQVAGNGAMTNGEPHKTSTARKACSGDFRQADTEGDEPEGLDRVDIG
jgi:hypothetical protein